MKKIFFIIALSAGMVFMTAFTAIADCLDVKVICKKITVWRHLGDEKGTFWAGQCWKDWGCEMCSGPAELARQCTREVSECANNSCAACYPKGVQPFIYVCTDDRGIELSDD